MNRNNWHREVLANARNVKFSSVYVGRYRVTLAKDLLSSNFAVAICSPRDAFDRKKGQAIAYTRLMQQSKRFAGQRTFTGRGGSENALEALGHLITANPGEFPQRLVRAYNKPVPHPAHL